MAQGGSLALRKVMDMLLSAESLPVAIGAIAAEAGVELVPINASEIRAQNIASELCDRNSGARYPCLYVYCERVSNTLREKFRKFSGAARMVVEIRGSQERLDGLEERLRLYADAVAKTLENNRGDWGDGVYYAGGYEVAFGAVRQGGKNFLQTAKAAFEVEISY
jgi:hypothetical protein